MDIQNIQHPQNKMKMLSIFLFGFISGTVFLTILNPKQELQTKEPIAVELSIGGEVRVLKANPDNSIHIITDEDMLLTDIQLLPHSAVPIQPTQFTKKYGQPSSQTLSSSSP